jgi:hypothetical protein
MLHAGSGWQRQPSGDRLRYEQCGSRTRDLEVDGALPGRIDAGYGRLVDHRLPEWDRPAVSVVEGP